jgi:hypothetical protein
MIGGSPGAGLGCSLKAFWVKGIAIVNLRNSVFAVDKEDYREDFLINIGGTKRAF